MNVNWIGFYTLISREIKRFLEVSIQTLVTPWINAVLYIVIFGFVIGSRIESIGGATYIEFVMPGILMMNILSAAFSQSSSSVFMQRYFRQIEELLSAPLSYTELILSYVVAAVFRGVIVGVGIYIIAIFVGSAGVEHIWLFLWYVGAVSAVFGLLGIIVGLWADNFEQFSLINTFLIFPLSFLGGVFNTIDMLPEKAQIFALSNPFFYFIDGLRYSMIGTHEGSFLVGNILIIGLIIVLSATVGILFKRGWRLQL